MKHESPHIMLPYQQCLLDDRSPSRIVEKSRRVGVTWALAAEMALEASEIEGCDGWYIGYNQDMSPEYIKDVAFWADKFNLVCSEIEQEEVYFKDDPDKSVLTYTIRFASGHKVMALSSKPRNLRNKRGHILIDEAAHHDEFDELLKAGTATEVWGGNNRMTIVSTHQGVDNPFNILVQDVRSGKVPMSLHRITIWEALKDGLYKRICLVNGKEWSKKAENEWIETLRRKYRDHFAEEFECIPSKSGGVYIGRDLIERAMVIDDDALRLEFEDSFKHKKESVRRGEVSDWCKRHLQPYLSLLVSESRKDRGLMHFLGGDFGRTADRTVFAVGQLTRKMKRRYPVMVELLNVPFEQQKQILFYIVDQLPRFLHGVLDATGNGSYLAEVAVQRYGEAQFTEAKITEPWYHENLPPFKAQFEDNNIELVIDRDHLLDLTAFQVIHGQPKLPKTKSKGTSGPPRHGDAGIALLCADIAGRYKFTQYEYDTPTKEHLGKQQWERAERRHQIRGLKGGIL